MVNRMNADDFLTAKGMEYLTFFLTLDCELKLAFIFRVATLYGK